jgi:hypothetical protein
MGANNLPGLTQHLKVTGGKGAVLMKPCVAEIEAVGRTSRFSVLAEPVAVPASAKRASPDLTEIPPGAILCTIKQAGEALGFGRTKVNELMNAGQLERREINGAVRITVESVRSAAGLPVEKPSDLS